MGRLDGKVAIVTGAGQGVGRGIAVAFASENASVVVAGRTVAKCEAVAAEIGPERALAVECDVKSADDIATCIGTAIDHFGGVDIVVNNAQEVPRGPLLSVTEEAFDGGWRSGPLATFRFMRGCHPQFVARGGGVVINLGSRSGIKPDQAGVGAYAAVKEAIRSLTRAAAMEWAADGIRVYALLPLSNSPALERLQVDEPDKYAQVLGEIPMRRFGDPETDIGRVAVFLASDDAAYLTGITITVDGGAGFVG